MPALITYNNRLLSTAAPLEPMFDNGAYRAFSGGIEDINNIPLDKRNAGMMVSIEDGSRFFILKPSPWTQTDLDWIELSITAKINNSYNNEVYFIDQETPLGLIDGNNKIFTLNTTPSLYSDHVYLNGLLQDRGESLDYVINENQLIFTDAPPLDIKIRCSYRSSKTTNPYFIDQEQPIGEIDGINNIFTMIHSPIDNSDHIYLNGLLQDRGENDDYIIDGTQIIFAEPPLIDSNIKCSYRF